MKNKLKSDFAQNILRFILIVTLALSIYSKFIAYGDFNNFMQNIFHVDERFTLFISNIILVTEIFLVILLLVNGKVNHVINIILYLFILFTFFNIYLMTINYTDNCFCFGTFLIMSPISSLLKNIFIIVLIIIVKKPYKISDFSRFELIAFLMSIIIIQFVITVPTNSFQESIKYVTLDRTSDTTKILFIDARHPTIFGISHIPGAINIPYYLFKTDSKKLKSIIIRVLKNENRNLVTYCDSKNCTLSYNLAKIIKQLLPDRNVFILDGGIEKWQKTH